MDAESGRVLLSRGETVELPIASTTKIMTAIVALEQCRMDELVTVKREQLREGSSMYLYEGERLSLEELLYGLMLSSGNDAAECIAGSLGGREDFVRAMNRKAFELGITHTAFTNPSGLDEKGHYSCALDMAMLMSYAMEQPAFARIVSTKTACAGERTLYNHNKLLGSLDGCTGGKTGYTGEAGRTLVTYAERDGLRLVAVTLHDGNDWQDHAALYEYGFSTFKRVNVLQRGSSCALAAVRGGNACCVELQPLKNVCIPLCEGEKPELHIDAQFVADAPVRKGQTLGYAIISVNGVELARTALYAACEVNAVGEVNDASEPGLWNRIAEWFSMP
ncbi:MAG: D-alanyl-D-alanine carboxypeptidase [Oscillospiraceae bacterium]|nr:D-alanyl-D-alanine carboxypeptidase [Oscillospiraceae bacterium]